MSIESLGHEDVRDTFMRVEAGEFEGLGDNRVLEQKESVFYAHTSRP